MGQQRRREQEYAAGRTEFIRSLDPSSSKEQTWDERQLGQKWKEKHCSEAMNCSSRRNRPSSSADHRGTMDPPAKVSCPCGSPEIISMSDLVSEVYEELIVGDAVT